MDSPPQHYSEQRLQEIVFQDVNPTVRPVFQDMNPAVSPLTQVMTCRKCRHEFDCPVDLVTRCHNNGWPMPNCPSCRKKRDDWDNLRQALQRLRFLIHPEGVPEELRAVMRQDPQVSEMVAGVNRWAVTIIRNSEEIVNSAKEYGMFRGFISPEELYDQDLEEDAKGGESVEKGEEESKAATASSS